MIAEKLKDKIPQAKQPNTQTVQIEHSNEAIATSDSEGAGESMAILDRENLV